MCVGWKCLSAAQRGFYYDLCKAVQYEHAVGSQKHKTAEGKYLKSIKCIKCIHKPENELRAGISVLYLS